MLERAYKKLLNGEINYFRMAENGWINDSPDCLWTLKINLYPGSWNPLHKGHIEVFKSIEVQEGEADWKAFELSIRRRDKEDLSLKELQYRVEQFQGKVPLIVTNSPRFLEKAGIFRGIGVIFHVGYDTAERLLNDEGTLGVEGINALFRVYERGGKDWNSFSLKRPRNFLPGKLKNKEHNHLSSTAIREGKVENAKV